MTTSLRIERATDEAVVDAVVDLLDAAGLPTADVRDEAVDLFVGRADGEVVAAGGLETCGPDALLRSVVVAESHRGAGHGTAVVEALLDRARETGVGTCYLLTTSASEFFAARGFERVERGAAPASVRATEQFAERCPDSAVCMRRTVG